MQKLEVTCLKCKNHLKSLSAIVRENVKIYFSHKWLKNIVNYPPWLKKIMQYTRLK